MPICKLLRVIWIMTQGPWGASFTLGDVGAQLEAALT